MGRMLTVGRGIGQAVKGTFQTDIPLLGGIYVEGHAYLANTGDGSGQRFYAGFESHHYFVAPVCRQVFFQLEEYNMFYHDNRFL